MMAENTDDYQHFMEQKRFLGEIEQAVRVANSEIIHKRINDLDKDKIIAG